MTEHLCKDGHTYAPPTWMPGTVKDCAVCKAQRQPRPVKRSRES